MNLPRLVLRGGRRLLPAVFCDIDGTVNDERMPESERLSTIGPARAALAALAPLGIPVVLASARSLAEARRYATALGPNPAGIPRLCVGEDGGALGVDDRDSCISGGTSPLDSIRHLVGELRAGGDAGGLHASCDPPASWAQITDASWLEILRVNSARVASAVVVGDTRQARDVLERRAPARGLRTFGEVLQVLPVQADKGRALRYVYRNACTLLGQEIDGLVPLAFGNGSNDLPLLRAAHDLGGMAALVSGHDRRDPFEREPDLDWLHRVGQPHGYGIAAGLRRMLGELW